jgi:hypothetical protein
MPDNPTPEQTIAFHQRYLQLRQIVQAMLLQYTDEQLNHNWTYRCLEGEMNSLADYFGLPDSSAIADDLRQQAPASKRIN